MQCILTLEINTSCPLSCWGDRIHPVINFTHLTPAAWLLAHKDKSNRHHQHTFTSMRTLTEVCETQFGQMRTCCPLLKVSIIASCRYSAITKNRVACKTYKWACPFYFKASKCHHIWHPRRQSNRTFVKTKNHLKRENFCFCNFPMTV